MIANLHTHSSFCPHARGENREYVECAIQAGIKALGFSDHAPMLFPGDYYSASTRMRPEQTEAYVSELLALREEFRGQIDLLIGFEIEYFPDLFYPTLEFLSRFPVDYMILGQHYLGNEIGEPHVMTETTDPDRLIRYVDQCIEALETRRFTYMAHPDACFFTGDPEIFDREYARLCRKALETETPLEINLHGAKLRRHYPGDRFFSVAARVGNPVLLGSDVHTPDELLLTEPEQLCREMAQRHGLTPIDLPTIRSPF